MSDDHKSSDLSSELENLKAEFALLLQDKTELEKKLLSVQSNESPTTNPLLLNRKKDDDLDPPTTKPRFKDTFVVVQQEEGIHCAKFMSNLNYLKKCVEHFDEVSLLSAFRKSMDFTMFSRFDPEGCCSLQELITVIDRKLLDPDQVMVQREKLFKRSLKVTESWMDQVTDLLRDVKLVNSKITKLPILYQSRLVSLLDVFDFLVDSFHPSPTHAIEISKCVNDSMTLTPELIENCVKQVERTCKPLLKAGPAVSAVSLIQTNPVQTKYPSSPVSQEGVPPNSFRTHCLKCAKEYILGKGQRFHCNCTATPECWCGGRHLPQMHDLAEFLRDLNLRRKRANLETITTLDSQTEGLGVMLTVGPFTKWCYLDSGAECCAISSAFYLKIQHMEYRKEKVSLTSAANGVTMGNHKQ